MSRTIKFRAWDKANKKVVHVTAINFYTKKASWMDEIPMDYLDGDCVLMQYTGFKDKNGKEIWEGDIVSCGLRDQVGGEAKIHQVVYEDAFILKPKILYAYYFEDQMVATVATNEDHILEVIGNIYENPELLNKAEIK